MAVINKIKRKRKRKRKRNKNGKIENAKGE